MLFPRKMISTLTRRQLNFTKSGSGNYKMVVQITRLFRHSLIRIYKTWLQNSGGMERKGKFVTTLFLHLLNWPKNAGAQLIFIKKNSSKCPTIFLFLLFLNGSKLGSFYSVRCFSKKVNRPGRSISCAPSCTINSTFSNLLKSL